MTKTWEVFAQSSEQEAHVKNTRQTKNTKQLDKMWIMHNYTNIKNLTMKYIVILGKLFKTLFFGKKKQKQKHLRTCIKLV